MKFELKTESDNYLKSFSHFFFIIFSFSLIILLCNITVKLGIISKHYQIEYICKKLSVDKSTTNFKKLSKLSKLKSKQRIWAFCREIIK